MKLSDYFESTKVVKDCEFSALGLSNSNTNMSTLSFVDDIKYLKEILNNRSICALICRKDNIDIVLNSSIRGIVLSESPRRTFFELQNKLSKQDGYYLPKEYSRIGNSCNISKLASIDNFGVIIGDNVVIEDFVSINGPCTIGNNTIIHSGAKIGGAGFEFKRYKDEVLDVSHCGTVEIGENVIIWENVTIHRAVYPWDKTTIGDWSRIGAQTHIDHGAKIDKFVEICARCIISGRVYLGDHVFVGPGSIISNRISVFRDAKVLIGSVVTKDVSEGLIVSGNFAIEHDKHMERVKADSVMVFR